MLTWYTPSMNERRATILDLVTEIYIRSVSPVASSHLAEQLQVSSATIRNELAALEDEGYLQQPHTSAGRIPTTRAYQQYAYKFIPPSELPLLQQKLVLQGLRQVHGDALLQQLAKITSELSGYAVVVSLPADDALKALEIHLSLLSSTRLLAVVVLENGLIRQLTVDLEPAPSDTTLRDAESNLRQLTLPVSEVPKALLEIAKRVSEDLARTLRAIAESWPNVNPARVFSQGVKQVLVEPESSNPSFVRKLLEQVEQPSATDKELIIILDESLAQIATRLPFGKSTASLMLLGPTRMRYKDALMVANGVTQMVSQLETAN
jgi:heat-inducible transcriptional repressor